MIVIVMGMSKSGTTLISKTLHHSGIDMNPERLGSYAVSKYEDPVAIKILKKMIGVTELRSLYLPNKINFNSDIEKSIEKYIASKRGDWGFKQPYMTLCYDIWEEFLPKHIAVGSRREPAGLLRHYRKGRTSLPAEKERLILETQDRYNNLMDSYNIPVIQFEEFLEKGPVVLEKIIGRKLEDVRKVKK